MLEKSKTNAVAIMKRPKGVTVMGCIFLLGAFVSFSSALYVLEYLTGNNPVAEQLDRLFPLHVSAKQLQRLFALHMVNLLIALILGIALLSMKRWSRWAAIAICAATLGFTARQVILVHRQTHFPHVLTYDPELVALKTLFCVWVIWYLTRPHIKAAFRSSRHQLA